MLSVNTSFSGTARPESSSGYLVRTQKQTTPANDHHGRRRVAWCKHSPRDHTAEGVEEQIEEAIEGITMVTMLPSSGAMKESRPFVIRFFINPGNCEA